MSSNRDRFRGLAFGDAPPVFSIELSQSARDGAGIDPLEHVVESDGNDSLGSGLLEVSPGPYGNE